MTISKKEQLKSQILNLVAQYYQESFPYQPFIEGKTTIPVSGKVFDEKELQNLVEAGLDFWLTTGRFAQEFEEKFAQWIGVKPCSLVNSSFLDINLGTYDLDISQLEEALSPKTCAILLAHTLGNPFSIDAKKLNNKNYPDFATSRSYYTMFYIAEALLLSENLSYSSHATVISALGKYLAKINKIPIKYHGYLIDAQDQRNRGDYDVNANLTKEDADKLIV